MTGRETGPREREDGEERTQRGVAFPGNDDVEGAGNKGEVI